MRKKLKNTVMKKIFLVLIIIISFIQNELVAQGCSDYFELQVYNYNYQYQSDCMPNPSLKNVRIYYVDENHNTNLLYNGSPSDLIDSIIFSDNFYPDNGQIHLYIFYDDCGVQKGCQEGFGDEIIEIPSENMLEFSWSQGFDNAEASAAYSCGEQKGWTSSTLELEFAYRVLPPNPTIESVSDLICNENDTIQLSSSFNENSGYTWKYSIDEYSSIIGAERVHTEILNNLNNDSIINLIFKVWGGSGSRLSCDFGLSPIAVYPRRPKIVQKDSIAPSCYAGGNGEIVINSIDGALGDGTNAVSKYKIAFSKSECPDNIEQGEPENLDFKPLTFKVPAGDKYHFIEPDAVFPITFDTTYFWNPFGEQNLLKGDSTYCILLENFYLSEDGNSGLSNGFTFTEITIPQKPILTGTAPNTKVDCNGDTNGEITLTVNGGNPLYSAKLFNSQGEMIEQVKEFSGQIMPNVGAEHVFSGLSADTFHIQLIDEYNCNVNNNSPKSDTIYNIIVSQPSPLKLDFLQVDSILCKGENNGQINIKAIGGNPFIPMIEPGKYYYKYNITKNGNSFINEAEIDSGSVDIINKLGPDTFRFELIDRKNCKAAYENNFNRDSTIIISEPEYKLTISDTTLSNYNNFEIDCHGNSSGTVILTPFGGYPEYKYKHKGDTDFFNDSIFNSLPAGEHTFYITDFSNRICLDSITVTLTEPDTLIINNITLNNYYNFNIRCHGYQDSIIVDAIGGVTAYQYDFNDTTDMQSSNVLTTNYGTKQIFIKDANNCVDSTTITLTQPASLPAIDSINTLKHNGYDVPCFGDSTAQITIYVNDTTGTTTDGTYMYSLDSETNFQTDSIFTNYPAGTYRLRIKDANGCLSNALEDTIQIIQPQLLQVSASSDTILNSPYNISCNGLSDGEIVLSAFGGVETYNYKFENSNSNDTISSLSAGKYSYYVTDLNSCISETDSITLTEPPVLTFNYATNNYFGNHGIRCNGLTDYVSITPTGGFVSEFGNYTVELISDANTEQQQININNTGTFAIVADTLYNIYIKDENLCIIDSVNVFSVTQPDEMQILFKDTVPTLCHNTSDGILHVLWSGGTSSHSNSYDYYLKQGSNIIQTLENVNIADTANFNGLSAYVSYKIIAIDDNACKDSTEISTTSPEELKANSTNTVQPLCFGDTLGTFTLSATGGTTSNPGYYDFSVKTSYGDSLFVNNTEQAVFENIATGNHQYFISDDNNCISDFATFNITEPSELIVNTTTGNVSAQGGSDGFAAANVQGGTNGGYSYKWRDAFDNIIEENNDSIIGFPAGDYSVEVWDANNCPYGNSSVGLKQYFTIYEPGQALELYIIQQHNVSVPGGNDGSVSLDANGGWNQKTYKIQGGIYTASPLFNDLAKGTYWFYVTDGFSTDSLQTEITEAEAMQIQNIQIQNVTCNGNTDGNITIIASGGTLPYLYSLDNVNFIENNYFENLSEGNYIIYVKDLYGNQISQAFSITQPEVLNLNFTNVQNTSCGQSDGSATAEVTGGTAPYIYNWYLNNEHIGQYQATAENLEAGLYTAEITDANLCTVSAQISIYNSNGPEIESITTTDASCFNSSDATATITGITASGSYTVQWSTGQTDVMSIDNLEAGNYSVSVNDENNCSVTEAFTVNAPDELNFDFNTNSPACYDACNGSIIANLSGGTAPYILEWQNINGNPSTNFVGSLCADDYILNVTDAHNCNYSATANLENPEPILILDENAAIICQGQSITLDAGNSGSTYIWTSDNGFQSTEQTVTLNQAGTYNITVYTPLGCIGEDEFTLNFSDNFLQANFLMQSEAEIADTVVLVEISWEAPDSVSWNIPSELWLLSQSEENIQLVPVQSGTHTVGLTAWLGTCSDYIEKQIIVSGNPDKGLQTKPEYTNDKEMQFKTVNLYPNPNKGNFTLDISLYEKNDIRVEVYDILGQRQQIQKTGKGEKNYTFNFNINNLKNGLYFISIKTNKGSAGVKFMKQ